VFGLDGLEEELESSPWCVYKDDKLLLLSVIVLKVKNQDRIDFLKISRVMEESGFRYVPGEFVLNTCSVFFWNKSVEIFIYKGIPYFFIRLYVYLDVIIEKFDAQAVSLDYFNFILEHGFISMDKGIIKVDMKKKEDEKVTPSLYGGLYNKD
jgi:hypothetical protein